MKSHSYLFDLWFLEAVSNYRYTRASHPLFNRMSIQFSFLSIFFSPPKFSSLTTSLSIQLQTASNPISKSVICPSPCEKHIFFFLKKKCASSTLKKHMALLETGLEEFFPPSLWEIYIHIRKIRYVYRWRGSICMYELCVCMHACILAGFLLPFKPFFFFFDKSIE